MQPLQPTRIQSHVSNFKKYSWAKISYLIAVFWIFSVIHCTADSRKCKEIHVFFPRNVQNYEEGLRYIGRLPFEQAESNMKRYGKTLMHHVPEGTTLLLKGLCTNYQPNSDAADKDSLDQAHINKVNL